MQENGASRPAGSRALDALIVTSGALTGLAISGLVPVLPKIEQALLAGPEEAWLGKLVIAAVGLAVMLAAPASALLTRRYACGPILIAAFLLYALTALAAGLAPSIELLVAARFVQGLAVAVAVTTVLALTGATFQGRGRDRRIGAHMAISALGLFVLMPVCGYLGEISWRLAPLAGLVALGHVALAAAARDRLRLRLTPPASQRRPLARAERFSALQIAGLALIIGLATYSPSAFLPFKLVGIGVEEPGRIALVTTLMMAGASAASFSYARIGGRLGVRATYVLAFTLGAAGMAGTALAATVPLICLALVLGSLGGGLLVAHIYGDSATRFDATLRVQMTGLIKSASFAGLFVGPLALQVVADRAGVDATFLAVALIMLAGLPAALVRRAAPTPLPAVTP